MYLNEFRLTLGGRALKKNLLLTYLHLQILSNYQLRENFTAHECQLLGTRRGITWLKTKAVLCIAAYPLNLCALAQSLSTIIGCVKKLINNTRFNLHEFVFDFWFGFCTQEIGHDIMGQGRYAILGDARQFFVALWVQHQRQYAVVAQLRKFLVGQILHDGRVLRGEHRKRVEDRRPTDIVPFVFQLEYQSVYLTFELVQFTLKVFKHQLQLFVFALHFDCQNDRTGCTILIDKTI